jgi:hypothetical protein
MGLSKSAQRVVEAYNSGYRVREDGRVVSPCGTILSPGADSRGYLAFSRKLPGECAKRVCVHRLAAYQKYGEALFAPGIETRHLDGKMTNNSLDNIAIGTHHDNIMDMTQKARVTKALQATAKQRKLDAHTVNALRLDHMCGVSYSELTARYGVTQCVVSYIVNGKTYSDV